MRLKRNLYLYVNDHYIGPAYTAWPIMRQLRYLQNRYPNAKSHEVTTERRGAVAQRCGSGWTGDRCSLALHHEGPHNN